MEWDAERIAEARRKLSAPSIGIDVESALSLLDALEEARTLAWMAQKSLEAIRENREYQQRRHAHNDHAAF